MSYISGLVSVVIPTFRRSDMITKAIDSVLTQTYSNVECIVVNDNEKGDRFSLDLYDRIKKYSNDCRFKLVEQDCHINGAAARNCGIRAAKGEYIAFLDDDDYWEKEKVFLQVEHMGKLDETWGAVSCMNRLYRNGKLIMSYLPYREGNILMDILCRRTGLGTGAVLFRRRALDSVGYFDENLKRHQDLQLFSEFANKYKIALVKKYLYNIECSDVQNQPTVESIVAVKNAYFTSIESVISKLSFSQKKRVIIMHNFESAYLFYRNGKKKQAIKYFLGVLKSPITLYLAVERVLGRIIAKKFKYYLDKHYSV